MMMIKTMIMIMMMIPPTTSNHTDEMNKECPCWYVYCDSWREHI